MEKKRKNFCHLQSWKKDVLKIENGKVFFEKDFEIIPYELIIKIKK